MGVSHSSSDRGGPLLTMKLLIVCGALFVATFASPVAEPTAEAAPTADADPDADAHLLYYGHYGLGSYYGLGHYYGHYGFPYAYWGRKKREATAAAILTMATMDIPTMAIIPIMAMAT